jgi:hypothetical protein
MMKKFPYIIISRVALLDEVSFHTNVVSSLALEISSASGRVR